MFVQGFIFILTFVSLAAFGACDGDASEERCAQHGGVTCECDGSIVGRRVVSFGQNDDKTDLSRKKKMRQNFSEEQTFVAKLKEELRVSKNKEICFSDVTKIAKSTFANTKDVWGRILEAVRTDKEIDVGFVDGCFFLNSSGYAAHPKDRIELAMQRIFMDNPATPKRDLVLMLYEVGYRDYAYEDIIAKYHALLGAGFCDPGPLAALRTEDFVLRVRGFWNAIRPMSKKESVELYLQMKRVDACVAYHMIHMKENPTVHLLQEELSCNSGAVYGLAQLRRRKILEYLHENANRACSEKDLLWHVRGALSPPKGMAFEIAGLVFLGEAKIEWSERYKSYTLTTKETMPKRPEGSCDELAFFHNLYGRSRQDDALLATYLQGFVAYAPERMLMFKRGVDLVGVGNDSNGPAQSALRDFLKKNAHKTIEPVWSWNQELSTQGKEFLTSFVHKDLNALFDLHNRGVLGVIQSYIEGCGHVYRTHQHFYKQAAKKHLSLGACSMHQFVTAMRRAGCAKKGSYDVLYTTVQDFFEHICYNIAEDVVTWVDEACRPPELSQAEQWKEVCFLRNRYPGMSVLDVGFVLMCKGAFFAQDHVRAMFHAVDVAGLVVTSRFAPEFSFSCKGFFKEAKEKSSPGSHLQLGSTLNGVQLCRRRKTIVLEAIELYKNEELRAFVQKIEAIPFGRFSRKPFGWRWLDVAKTVNPGTSREVEPPAQKHKKCEN